MQFIDLHRQFNEIEQEVRNRFDKILEHKGFIGGQEVKEIEKELAEYVGVKHVICCASGTDALTIPLKAYDLKKNDAVFVPSFTFFASAESITLAGGTPIFVDSDYETYNIDTDDLVEKIEMILRNGEYNPRGIVAVDLFGQPANFNRIKQIAEKYNLFILEDGAQGFGGSINGKKACSFGNVAATSFFPAKPLGCYGDGGAIFTDDDKLANLIESIHVHGKGSDKYDNVRIGYNSRLDTFQAAVLLEKMKIFDQELIKRNNIAQLYSERLAEYFEVPKVLDGYNSSWAQFTLKTKDESSRDYIVDKMKNAGIPVMVYYPIPIHKSGAYKNNIQYKLPICEELSKKVFSIPMHPYLSNEEIDMICDTLISIVK